MRSDKMSVFLQVASHASALEIHRKQIWQHQIKHFFRVNLIPKSSSGFLFFFAMLLCFLNLLYIPYSDMVEISFRGRLGLYQDKSN